MSRTKKNREILTVGTRTVYSTRDYSIFKGMDGNRDVDEKHVKQLQKLMLDNGNLTHEFPIIVNKDMLVVDGQHRLKALEGLGWEVGYTVQDEASIATVRAINRGNRNWNWVDIASSYAKLGNEEYQWFLDFALTYKLSLKGAMAFAGFGTGGSNSTPHKMFHDGEMRVADKPSALKMAKDYREVCEAGEIDNSAFSLAFASIHKSPYYNQERMVQKMDMLGSTFPQAATKMDYMRKLEEAFNHKLADENRVRFF